MLSDSGDDEDTLEKEGGDTHNAGWLKSALFVIRAYKSKVSIYH